MSKKSKRTESNLPRYSESPSFQRKTINSALFKNSESMQSNKKEESSFHKVKISNEILRDPLLESIMATSPNRYFYSLRDNENLSKYEKNQQNDKNKGSTFYNQQKKSINSIMANNQTKENSKTMRENVSLIEKNANNRKSESIFENLEFLKKIYNPRSESREKMIEIKNNIIKNKFFSINENSNEKKFEHKSNKLSKKFYNFRIRAEKNNVINSINSEGSIKSLSLGGITTDRIQTKKKSKYDQIKNDQYLDFNNEKIKQNSTYKLIENKTLEKKYEQNREDRKKEENKFKITNQPNSVNISVNLKPTFHLSLNSNLQNENLKQILESFQLKSNDIQISHPDSSNIHKISEPKLDNVKTKKNSSTSNEKHHSELKNSHFKNSPIDHYKTGHILNNKKIELNTQQIVEKQNKLKKLKNEHQTNQQQINTNEEFKEKEIESESEIELINKNTFKRQKSDLNTILKNKGYENAKENINEPYINITGHVDESGEIPLNISLESQLEAKNEEYKKTHTKIRESTNKKERLSIGETQQRSRSETFIEKKSSLPEKENLNSMNEGPKHSPLNKVDSYCSTPLQQAFLSQSLKFIDSPSENDQKMSEENENLLKVHRNSNLYLSSNKSNPKNRRDTKKFIVNRSFEMVRKFNKQQSEEEKEALNIEYEKLNKEEISGFKSQFYRFSNELVIPKQHETTITILKKNEAKDEISASTKNEIKLLTNSNGITSHQKNMKFYSNRLNLNFFSKNSNYRTNFKFKPISNERKRESSFDNNKSQCLKRKKTSHFSRFEENKKKFFEKLLDFYNFHQNPFYYQDQDDGQIDLKSKLLMNKVSFFHENNIINLSEILSKKGDSNSVLAHSFQEEDVHSSSSSVNTIEEEESEYNFTMGKSNERFTIKINPPPLNLNMEPEAINRSFTRNISPIMKEIKKNSKSEKNLLRSSSDKKLLESLEAQKKKFLNNIKSIFEQLEFRSSKIFDIYNFNQIRKIFKIVFFTTFQIFLSENFYEILTMDLKEVRINAYNLEFQEISIKKSKNQFYSKKSSKFSCPLSLLHLTTNEIYNYKISDDENILAFDYKIEINEKGEESEKDENEIKKCICKNSDEEGDSPLLLWDPISKLSLTMEEDFQIAINKMNESQMSLIKDDDNYELENNKNTIRLINGKKIEMTVISFKSLEILIKYLLIAIIPIVTHLESGLKNEILGKTPLGPEYNINQFLQENGNLINQIKIYRNISEKELEIEKKNQQKEFILKSVVESQEIKLLVKMSLLNHDIINKGGFEDFIFIPNELRGFFLDKTDEKNFDPFDIIEEQDFEENEKTNGKKEGILRSRKTISDSKLKTEEDQDLNTCQTLKERKFFPSNEEIEKPEIFLIPKDIEKNPEKQPIPKSEDSLMKGKVHLKSQRKSLTCCESITNNLNMRNSDLKKLKREASKRNLFGIDDGTRKKNKGKILSDANQIEELQLSDVSSDKTPSNINNENYISKHGKKSTMIEIPLNNLTKDKTLKNLNSNKKNEIVSTIDKDHLSPQNSPYMRNRKISIKKGEKSKDKSSNSIIMDNFNEKKSKNVPTESDASPDKMERSFIFVKTQMIYENQRKYMSIFEEMKWAVIHGKLNDLQYLLSKYSMEYIDRQDELGNTLLMYAAINGDDEIINFLISKSVNADQQNNNGDCALHFAISYGNDSIADLLVAFGVNQNLRNNDGKAPWDLTQK